MVYKYRPKPDTGVVETGSEPEGSHGLADKGIEKDEPEDSAIFALGGLG